MAEQIRFSSRIVPDEWLGHFDMLRDTKRNKFYADNVQRQGNFYDEMNESELCIDIGCGAGLLCCLVAKRLHRKCIAFECNPKLAEIARENIFLNGLQELVSVILCHTSDLDYDYMFRTFHQGRASSCVAELLDTTFYGEGLYDSMLHAKKCLLRENPNMIIPRRAKLYVQAFGGRFLGDGADVVNALSLFGLRPSREERTCCGPPSASTIQMNPLIQLGAVHPVSDAVLAFEVDLLNMLAYDTITLSLQLESSSSVTAIVLFWEAYCDNSSELSTAIYDKSGRVVDPTCDHWRQAVFCQKSSNSSSSTIQVQCHHNEDDVWVNIVDQQKIDSPKSKRARSEDIAQGRFDRPVCTCGLHSSSSMWRMIQLNSTQFTKFIKECQIIAIDGFNKYENKHIVYLVLGDSMILGPAILMPIFEKIQASSIMSMFCPKVTIIIACTTQMSLMYTEALLFANFPKQFVEKCVFLTVLEFSDHSDVTVLFDRIKQVTLPIIDSNVSCSGEVFVEPYVEQLQEEWGLEQFLMLCDYASFLRSSSCFPSQCNFSIDTVELWCSLFSSQSLWDEYSSDIGIVEGIDMSAVNGLLREKSWRSSEVTPCRLSQWNAKLFGDIRLASLSMEELMHDSSKTWTSALRQVICDRGSLDSSVSCHGLAFWTIFKSSRRNAIALSSHPNYHPETLQAFCCFEKSYDLEKIIQENVNISLSVEICKSNNVFSVNIFG